MPEALGKGIASHISALKDTAPLAAKKQALEPISRWEPAPLKTVDIKISKRSNGPQQGRVTDIYLRRSKRRWS